MEKTERKYPLPVRPQTLILLLILSQAFDVITTYIGIQVGLTEGNTLIAPIADDLLSLIEFKLIFFFPIILLPVALLYITYVASMTTKRPKEKEIVPRQESYLFNNLLQGLLFFLLVWSWAVIVNNLIGIAHITMTG
ncbi:MAG: hypothetical protein QF415_05675 [Candidatus Undinarchaeales archaeon]|jgi:hypothetical protein|nr:hypothetical protein [Candidatus Undinarchaeales archaeon]MDP7491964.1 hypothetical protein [Candidatus Undinarchaeales archaeon]